MYERVSGRLDCYVLQLCHLHFCVRIYAVGFQNKQGSRPSGYNMMMDFEGGTVPLILV